MKNYIFPLLSILFLSFNPPDSLKIVKDLSYDKYTLDDNYIYNKKEREFQWDKISQELDSIELFLSENYLFGILKNYKNINGIAPVVAEYSTDDYGMIQDKYNVQRAQSVPLYEADDKIPVRYGRDGSLVAICDSLKGFYTIKNPMMNGHWKVPTKYVSPLEVTDFNIIIFVDKTNQNIASLEKVDSVWYVRSMNPATTGVHKPPYQKETPTGVFVLQSKQAKMVYYADGTREIGGFAPYASRFCCGGYIHGIPVNAPSTKIIEYSATLGTIPRSHMCVRNATSHAKFIYDLAEINKTLIFVIE